MRWRADGVVALALALAACGGEAAAPVDVEGTVQAAVQATTRAAPASTSTPAPPAAPATPARLDAGAVQQALASSGLPVSDVHAFTAETDPNQLLGRPNQYTVKVSWKDERAPAEDATIEVFPDLAALRARQTFTEAISQTGGPFTQYIFPNERRLALLRLPRGLTPDQADAYRRWLDTL
jgi:hypothetical protein